MASPSLFKRVLTRLIGLLSIIVSITLLLSYLSPFVSSNTLWWIQLFGLAYPIILICFIIILPFIFFFKRKRWWLMMVILIIGLPVHIRFISFGSEGISESNSDRFKVTSFNVRGFDTYQWTHPDLESAEKAFLSFIKENNADILCFQEYTLDKRSSKHMLPSEIKAAGQFKYYAKKVTVQTINLDFGLAIYSKYPIVDQGLVGEENDLYSLFIDVQIKEDTIRIYNTHLQSIRLQQDEYSLFDENAPSNKNLFQRITGLISKLKNAYPSRLQQAKNVTSHAKNCSYQKVICGDFNEPPTSYTYSVFNDQFYDAYRSLNFGTGRTYAGKIPAGRIDYILFSEKLNPSNFELANDKLLSDHYPISVEFSLK